MSDKYKYPAISPSQLSGQQAITGLNGEKLSTLSEYWSWAHSDLLGNTERGIFAEYLVRLSLKIQEPRQAWGKYDLLYKDKIRIEVQIELNQNGIQTKKICQLFYLYIIKSYNS